MFLLLNKEPYMEDFQTSRKGRVVMKGRIGLKGRIKGRKTNFWRNRHGSDLTSKKKQKM